MGVALAKTGNGIFIPERYHFILSEYIPMHE